jgi:hypothetical protein
MIVSPARNPLAYVTMVKSHLVVTICPNYLKICNAAFCIYGFCMVLTVNRDHFLEQD